MPDLTFGEQVKIILSRKGMTIKQLAEIIEETTGKKMSRQNLTQRLGRDNFQEQDMRMIAEVLGCSFSINILDDSISAERIPVKTTQPTIEKEEVSLPIEAVPVEEKVSSNERDITVGEILDIHEELDSLAEAAAEAPVEEVVEEIPEEIPEEVLEETSEEYFDEEDAYEESYEEVYEEAYEDSYEEPVEEAPAEEPSMEELLREMEEIERENKRQKEEREQRQSQAAEERRPRNKWRSYLKFGRGEAESEKKPSVEELHAEPDDMVYTEFVYDEQPAESEYEEPAYEEPTYEEPVSDEPVGDFNPYTGKEYQTNSVRIHPKRIGYVQVYDRADHAWTDMTEWAFLGYQERKKALLGKDYEPPIYLD